MKVLLFYKSLITPGGAERLIIEEYKAFKSLGYDVKVVVFDFDRVATFGEDFSSDLIELKSWFWFFSLFKLVSLFRRNQPSLIISSSGIIEVALASFFANTKFYLHLHHPMTMKNETEKYSFFLRKKYGYILARSYEKTLLDEEKNRLGLLLLAYISARQLSVEIAIKRASHIFVLSHYAREELNYLYNVNSLVLQGAIDTADPCFERASLPCEANALKVLCISRLEPQKRIDQAILAFEKVLEKSPSAIMFIGGSGPQEQALKALVKNLGLCKSVNFLGFIPNKLLMGYYNSADIFLSLDWADFNITVIEALSAGTNVVVSNEGEFDKRFVDNANMLLVDPKNHKLTANAILQLHGRKEHQSDDERRDILRLYTWKEYCKNIIKSL